MTVRYSRLFRKQFQKLDKKDQDRFWDRLEIFKHNRTDSRLKMHSLHGKYSGYYSINITGDIRAIYVWRGKTAVLFGFIGTHSQLYK